MGDLILLSNFSRPLRLIELSNATQMASRTLAENSRITKRVTWHTFRHSLASFLGQSGENVKTVQELLRHASSRLTQDVYQQGNTEAKRLAIGRVAGIFAVPDKNSLAARIHKENKASG